VTIHDRVAVGTVLPPDAQFYPFDGVDGVSAYRYAYIADVRGAYRKMPAFDPTSSVSLPLRISNPLAGY